jgi:NOL1/NOP2/fmu family ribosome biogenesis protein
MKNPNLILLDAAKKKKIIDKLGYLGIKKIPHLLIQTGRERITAFSGFISREEISELGRLLSIEGIGLYFAKDTLEGFRVSLDALHLLKKEISSNIIEIDEKQEREWFLGRPVILNPEQSERFKGIGGFVAVKSGEDFIGTGRKAKNQNVVSNFLPKERRVKS